MCGGCGVGGCCVLRFFLEQEAFVLRVGLDVGSTTIKCVVLDAADKILYSTYERHFSHIELKSQMQ